jgi:hypothetical protein
MDSAAFELIGCKTKLSLVFVVAVSWIEYGIVCLLTLVLNVAILLFKSLVARNQALMGSGMEFPLIEVKLSFQEPSLRLPSTRMGSELRTSAEITPDTRMPALVSQRMIGRYNECQRILVTRLTARIAKFCTSQAKCKINVVASFSDLCKGRFG